MATQAGVGFSVHRDPDKAAAEAVGQALKQAGIDRADIVFLFATVGYPQDALLRAVRKASGGGRVAGCSGEGVITNNQSIEAGHGITVGVLKSDDIRFSVAAAEGLRADSEKTGFAVGETLRKEIAADTFAIFAFPDGVAVNFDRFREGLTRGLGLTRFLPIFGGTAADNWQLQNTYQYCDDRVVTDGATVVLFSGPGSIISTFTHGALPIGELRTITKADKNVIQEIEGKPALSVLNDYLAFDEFHDWGKAITNVALGFQATDALKSADEYYVRYIPQKDEAKGTISISTEVESGAQFWMMRRDHDKIRAGIERAVERLKTSLQGKKPSMFFQFDCCGRGCILFPQEQKMDLIRRLQTQLGGDVPWIGFHSYGELGPVGEQNHFHNQTVVVAALC